MRTSPERFAEIIEEIADRNVGNYGAFRDEAILFVDRLNQSDNDPDGPMEAMLDAVVRPETDDACFIAGRVRAILDAFHVAPPSP